MKCKKKYLRLYNFGYMKDNIMSYISSLTFVLCPYLFMTIFTIEYKNKLVSEYPSQLVH